MKKTVFSSVLLLLCAMVLLCIFCNQPSCAAEVEHEFLTPQIVVLKYSGTLTIENSSIPLAGQGSWVKENGLIRDRDGRITREADITHFLYLQLASPLQSEECLILETSGGKLELRYDADVPSNVFKLNQLGYGMNQARKYAYIGAWLGSSGPLSLQHLAGKNFEIRNAASGVTVFTGVITLRMSDPVYHTGVPFTGEEVAELDCSNFTVPGRYYFYVDGVGRSMDFVIDPGTISEAFYIHARGLYHKRCGIAKELPFTAWVSPACHQTVFRGRFPGNADDYRKGKAGENGSGFFDRHGNRMEVRHFELISQNRPYRHETISVRGGWHDAADYDRRPYHLRIVSDLAMVYLMKSENFIDGQLNIPESGNGIPDILDEAAWGLSHLLTVQQDNGGVGTWFETTGHPQAGEGLPDGDKYTYFVSAPSRNGTLEYAAAAGTLALAMKKAGAASRSSVYLRSAQRAWEFALDLRNRLVTTFIYRQSVVFYREDAKLDGENLLRAGLNLYLLTGDEKYLDAVLSEKARIKECFNRDFWKWSPLSWMMLELSQVEQLNEFRMEYRNKILQNAGVMLDDQEKSYPYRTLWYGPHDGWVHSMAWGNYHPLRRAVTLIAAHRITGEEKYLTGAYLANDFHNGANPLGRSMTSGLGQVYPVVFLDLVSYADGIGEFVPGITPYGNTFGIDRNAVRMVYGENADKLPFFRRYVNLEFLSVPSSEYSVWETVAPAAVVSGYLIEKAVLPTEAWKSRRPAADFTALPGYRALP